MHFRIFAYMQIKKYAFWARFAPSFPPRPICPCVRSRQLLNRSELKLLRWFPMTLRPRHVNFYLKISPTCRIIITAVFIVRRVRSIPSFAFLFVCLLIYLKIFLFLQIALQTRISQIDFYICFTQYYFFCAFLHIYLYANYYKLVMTIRPSIRMFIFLKYCADLSQVQRADC